MIATTYTFILVMNWTNELTKWKFKKKIEWKQMINRSIYIYNAYDGFKTIFNWFDWFRAKYTHLINVHGNGLPEREFWI